MGDTAIFITARMGSSRLPGKHMLEVNGEPMIKILIDRAYGSKVDYIVLCTTMLEEDKILTDVAYNSDISYFRGHPADLLYRWYEAAQEYGVSNIISVHGDNPLCDPYYIDDIVKQCVSEDYDFAEYPGLPFGVSPYFFTLKALMKAIKLSKDYKEKEGQYRWFTQTGKFNIGYLIPNRADINPGIRMTYDYPEDYEFFKKIIENLGTVASLPTILEFLKRNPEVIKINAFRQKEYEERFANLYPDLVKGKDYE